MLQSVELTGNGWWPSRPADRRAGSLRFTDGEYAELSLIGAFEGSNPFDRVTPEIVLGIGSSGQRITLYNCHPGASVFNLGSGPSTQVIRAQFLFVGVHFEKESE